MEFGNYPSLKGRSVFITGGASGIGEAMVTAFAGQGAKVGFVDIDQENGEKLAKACAKSGKGEAHFEPCDLRDIASLQTAFSNLEAKIGPASILINNAARDDRHDWREVTPEYWDERSATNLRHFFFAIQAVVPGMIEAGGGAIVNMGSVSWMMPQGGFPAYATSKSAVHGLTRTMARDLGPHKIRVNTLVPGWIVTERQKELWLTPEAEKAHLERQCLKEMIEPVYVARMALFLASDDAAMCTAQSFLVEGGTV